MVDDPKSLSRREALLKEAEVLLKETAAYARLRAIYAELGRDEPIDEFTKDALDHLKFNQDYLVRMPLKDSVLKVLKTAKEPVRASQIWRKLADAGRAIDAEDPVRSVTFALKKLREENDDVFSPGWGKWGLRSIVGRIRSQRMIVRSAGRGGHGKDEHVAKTKAGLEKAKASGKKLGADAKITDEILAEIIRLRLDERLSAKKAMAKFDMALSTYYSRHLAGGLSILDHVNKAKEERVGAKGNPPDLLTPKPELRLVK